MEFVAATNNRHKLDELTRLLTPAGHTVVSMASVGVEVTPNETGETFAENARIKAEAVCRRAGVPALADDSGLRVEALGGDPGVRSARFAGFDASDEENCKKLMHLLERYPYAKRGASFHCALALAMPDGRVLTTEGECAGRIGLVASGSSGFGYDPLFYVGNVSFADMEDAEKDAVSHRAMAVKNLLAELPGFLGAKGAAPAQPSAPPAEPAPGE
ncbi:RdgB/HAM1 family non-canonical purine NTP pyrophosphatase [Ruminococcaceae bacterium OttesenSCG-928-A11]|nr:RdgB/HAM1 family non-canonical purine NTP pyrophosphatase [Ruminococcaceae bacterium OttesenSCG-928-A11]